MTYLVYSEDRELAFQLLGKARELADKTGSSVAAIVVGESQEYVKQGADKALKADLGEFNVETVKEALLEAVKMTEPSVIMIGATKRGKEVAPRVAAALGVGCMTECSSVDLGEDGKIIVERLTYGGSTVAKETSTSTTTVITVPSRSFEKLEPKERTGEIIELTFEAVKPRVKVLKRREKPRSSVDLESAPVIISAGRGFKTQEDLKILDELAEVLGAQISCTRPISADLGWMDQWVGISGKKVKPSLYVACGISGTIQHVAGIRDSQIIVSINNDESAGIHGLSDYSIVGDLYEVIPALAKALKEAS
ncbi:MAG: electron transfer flavoprotein subunit alpha/FixB family protein [Candidatus Bathyarchaeota archaeon]|nr:electron transfer flavoprotein subunit alpha/FixB family protein [Candidatus Bathyarchaeota archaeon]